MTSAGEHSDPAISASSRWFRCPASVQLCRGLDDPGNPAAAEGTCAHELAYEVLTTGRGIKTYIGHYFNGIKVDEEMAEYVLMYVEMVQSYVEMGFELYAEHRVYLDPVCPGLFGTADAILINIKTRELVIIDLKYGRVLVHAENNEQLLLYIIGALNEFGLLFEPLTFTAVICQPRQHHFPQATYDASDISAFAITANEAFKEINDPNPKFVAGEVQCKYCLAKKHGVCPELNRQKNIAVYGADNTPALRDVNALTHDELAEIYPSMDLVISFCQSVKEKVMEDAARGHPPPGYVYKPTGGRKGNRVFTDVKKVATLLKGWGYATDAVAKASLLSVAQIEKVISDEHFKKLEGYIDQPEGKPRLVKDDRGDETLDDSDFD